eukprot:Gb_25929 [translate_table: standard]
MMHEYSAIMGIEELVHDISINLRGIVLQSDPYEIREAFIYSIGPIDVTSQDIILPPSVRIIDTTQHIASLKESITSNIRSQIGKDRGYRIQSLNNSWDGFFTDVVSMPVRNENYSIHSYGNGNEMQEILFFEIWKNGSLAPGEALYEASWNLIDLFIPFMRAEEQNIDGIENWNGYNMSLFPFSHISTDIEKMEEEIAFKHIFIDQSELPPRVYNCLKRVNIHTLSDLLNYS